MHVLQSQLQSSAETQKVVANNGENLLQAVNFFASNLQTLVEKTTEDTLITVRNYENARWPPHALRLISCLDSSRDASPLLQAAVRRVPIRLGRPPAEPTNGGR